MTRPVLPHLLTTRDVGVLHLGWFGAVGDGVTDDTANIQAAHDALPSVGGTLVGQDGATYRCGGLVFTKPVCLRLGAGGISANASPVITTTRNLRVEGQSEGATVIAVQAAGTGILLDSPWGEAGEGEASFVLSRLTITGGARHVDAGSLAGFYEGDFHCEHVTFNGSSGIAVELADSVYYGRFTRCQWVQCYTWAKIHSYTETKFTHCVMKQSNTGGVGLHLYGSHHTEMHFCQLYGYAPNVNPDILIEPTINQTQGYLELHRVKFGAEREYWHRKSRNRIKHANTTSGEEHFSTTDVRLRFCEFLGPAALVLSSIGRAANVATATVTSAIADGHGIEVGDVVHIINVSDTSFCGEVTITAKATNTISWASTGANVGQSDRGGFVASAETEAVKLASPASGWVYDSCLFYGYGYAVGDTFTEKATTRDLSGRCVWLSSNRVYGPLGKGGREFRDGGRGFSHIGVHPTSSVVPFTQPRVSESASGLINRAPYSENLDAWGSLGVTVTTGQTDPWGTTRACKIARSGANNISTGAGAGGYTLLEGLARSFEQSSPALPERGFVSFWAKADTATTLWVGAQDGGGLMQFQHNVALASDWRRYVIPVVWNAGVGTMQCLLCPGGQDAEVSSCYVTGFQISDEDTDYLPTGATYEQRAAGSRNDVTVLATVAGQLAPGSYTLESGQWHIQYKRLQLTGSQRLTLTGTAREIITDL